ncbi:MAG: GxxExxY protein [Planctomycetes bacterium]|nr:GxxExxY protein [Planctomycetota bacterium]
MTRIDELNTGTGTEVIIHKELSYKIIEASFEVHNTLGPGFTENIYEEALCRELKSRGLNYERQKVIDVLYKGEKIGVYRLDLIVENKVLLELKAISELPDVFKAQVLSYLKATGLKLGILVNFGKKKVEYDRIVN